MANGLLKATQIAFSLSLIVLGGGQSTHAAIVGEDNRQELEHFSLTAEERAAIYQIVGEVKCWRQGMIGGGTAFVIDGGQHLLSNAHVFREGDQRCSFSRKQSKEVLPIDVDKATAGDRIMMRNREDRPEGVSTASQDWIIVPLRTPTWTPVFKLGATPQTGEELLLVGVRGAGKELDQSKLVGRRCTVEERFNFLAEGQDILATNCDTTPGDSGAPIFIRRNGVLEVVAINEGNTTVAAHGKTSIVDRDKTWGVTIDGPLRKIIDDRFAAAPSATLLKPFHDPNFKPLIFSPKPQVGGYPGYTRVVPVEPTAPREELTLSGMKLRDLTPDDKILYGIPDDVKGVLVSSIPSRVDFLEGDVLFGESLEHLSKLRKEGIVSLTVNVRKIGGQTAQQTLSIE